MARIRSVHPGLFTDENYAVLSFPARELLKGLWTEADDNGIFEWKPLSIKMRIFPADAVDVPALLEELANCWIRKFEADGKVYGACKNFCQYQRPKEPKSHHPLPEDQKAYVKHGYKARKSEKATDSHDDVADYFPTTSPPLLQSSAIGGENSGQMEEGGGRRSGSSEEAKASSGSAISVEHGSKPAWWPIRDRYGRVTSEITEKIMFDVGKAVLGSSAGGQVTRMRKAYQGDMRAVVDFLLQAEEKSTPSQWFAACLTRAERDQHDEPRHSIFPMETHH